MDESQNPDVQTDDQQTEEPHGAEVDWKKEARKWEARAKANSDAAAELEKLRDAQRSDAEKLEKRAADAEAKLAEYVAKEKRASDAAEVAKATGVPADVLAECADRESMEALADKLKDVYANQGYAPSAPPAPGSKIVRGGGGKRSNRDIFAEYVSTIM